MRLLVDTFNVLHVTGVLPPGLAGPDTRGLAALIATSRWSEAHVALVCDGTPPQGAVPRLPGGIRAIYSGAKEADEILERLIEDSTAPGRLVVVSSDRRVRRAARRRGAKDLDSASFLRILLDDRRGRPREDTPHRPAALRPGEVATWQDLFKVREDQLEITDEDLPPHLRTQAPTPTPPAAETPRPRRSEPAPDPASILPPDLLEEARALLSQDTPEPTPKSDATSHRPPPPANSPPPTSPPPADKGPMPDDIIKEAEDLLRDLSDPDRD
ncbi:MAG: NYN domain-containing protein [Phycisphaerales bacterium]|nr:NYN domain-containing protein [Phycisphaerales bacterium]